MKKYINTSNYYLSTTTSKIENTGTSGTFDVSDVTVDWVTLPLTGYYWVDVDFGDASKREIFRIVSRTGYTLTYDARISPYGMKTHQSWASVGLRDFSQLLNSLSTNTDNFWEVEQTWDLTVLVRGGNVFVSGNAYKTVETTTFTFNINETKYIEYDWASNTFTLVDIPSVTNYLIAQIETNATMINSIVDKRSTLIYWGWEWDIKWSDWLPFYDPEEKKLDVYQMENMAQGTNKLYSTPEEKQYWNEKQEQLVSWVNIQTINWQSILQSGNISLDTILTVWWYNFTTEDWAESFTFEEWYYPLNEWAFIVFTDSGTMMIQWVDYIYDDNTHTITFTSPLASTEHAYIWVMCNTWQWQTEIWSWVVTFKKWNTTLWSLNVNQPEDSNIDIAPAIWEWNITITQWNTSIGSINVNQSGDQTVALQGNIPVTQAQYDALPASKETDWNWYFIYEE